MESTSTRRDFLRRIALGSLFLLPACNSLPNYPQEIFRADEGRNEAPVAEATNIDYSREDEANDFRVINGRSYLKGDEETPIYVPEFVEHIAHSPLIRIPEINASYVELSDGNVILSYPARTTAPELKELVSPHLPCVEISIMGNNLMFVGPREEFNDNFRDLVTILNTYDVPAKQIRIDLRIVEYFNDNTYDREMSLRWLRDSIEVSNLNLPSSPDLKQVLTTGIDIDPLNIFRGRNESTTPPRDVYEAAVKFLDSHGKTNTLASLDVLVSNGKPAAFTNQSEIPYPEVVIAGNNAIETLKYKPTGVVVKMTPYANEEGFINLNIEQAESGEQTGFAGTLQRPIFRTSTLSSEFTVREGLTYYAATSLFTRYRSVMRGIPGLNKVPIIRHATSSISLENNQSQLLYFVTARVIPRASLTGVQIKE